MNTIDTTISQDATYNLRDRALKGRDQGYLSTPVYETILQECDKIDARWNHMVHEKKRLENQLRIVVRRSEQEAEK
jgi:hypothetical protein